MNDQKLHAFFSQKISTPEAVGHRVNRESVWKDVLLCVVVCVICIAGLLFIRKIFFLPVVSPIADDGSGSQEPTDPLGPRSFLLLGYGGGAHEGALLTDTMIIARMYPRLKKVILISLPRDILVHIPVKKDTFKDEKINAAYAIGTDDRNFPDKPKAYTGEGGGGRMAKDIVGAVVGFTIDQYVALSFEGFIRAIDGFGGLDIDVPSSFVDEFYPIEGKEKDTCERTEEDIRLLSATISGYLLEQAFTCRFERLEFTKGKTHMDGKIALTFVRSRHSDQNGGDFGRSLRQQALLKSLRQKIISLGIGSKLYQTASALKGAMETDITLLQSAQFLTLFGDVTTYDISTLVLGEQNVFTPSTTRDGQYVFVPKEKNDSFDSVHAFIASESARLIATSAAGIRFGN
ncbi:LCP family protein [Candidatus Gottesmanbacteria bacterium]|nr:LCP family protein [Candidatus Gottesmanbacteria bacterium]